jgi:hypothetical protein
VRRVRQRKREFCGLGSGEALPGLVENFQMTGHLGLHGDGDRIGGPASDEARSKGNNEEQCDDVAEDQAREQAKRESWSRVPIRMIPTQRRRRPRLEKRPTKF